MRKRKERVKRSENLIPYPEGKWDKEFKSAEKEEEEEGGNGFFACYLLCSLKPRCKEHTYIGFTVNPQRRIRQHNGELTNGASKTKKYRPWEMILCLYGFPTNVSALQFEWAWQHPKTSLAVRTAAESFKSLNGVANKIKLAYTMLTLPPWKSLKLTVNFFSTKYTTLSAGCPTLPKQMKIQICPIDELPCYIGGYQDLEENEDVDEDDDGYGNGDDILRESLTDISVHNSVESHRGDIETANDLQRWIEDNDLRWPRDSPTSNEDFHKPSFPYIDSPWGTMCSSIPSLGNTREVEDKDQSQLVEESSAKLGELTERLLIPLAGINNNQPPSSDNLPVCQVDFSHSMDSFILEKEDREPFCLFDSPRVLPSSITVLVNEVDSRYDSRDSAGLIEESNTKLEQSSKQQQENSIAANNDRPVSTNRFHISPEVEVINLLTPSSDCMIHSFHKRKKTSRVCQKNIIDLTRSPIFVQL